MAGAENQSVVIQDEETGESFVQLVNRETGENYRTDCTAPPSRQTLRPPMRLQTRNSATLTICEGTTHKILLGLACVILPTVASILIIILEVYLHMKCHIKNRAEKKDKFYYRSPFHALTRIFCGACRESDSAHRVGLLQDKRRNRYHYFQGMVY